MSRKNHAFGLVEVLIVAVILSITVISYLTLTGSETQWSRQVNDKAKALLIASNVLAFYDVESRAPLHPGGASVPQDEDSAFPEDKEEVTCQNYDSQSFLQAAVGKVACGGNLGIWLKEVDGRVAIWFTKQPKDESGTKVDYSIGRLRCVVSWTCPKGGERWAEVIKIYPL